MLLRMEGIGSRTNWNNMKERLHTLRYGVWSMEFTVMEQFFWMAYFIKTILLFL